MMRICFFAAGDVPDLIGQTVSGPAAQGHDVWICRLSQDVEACDPDVVVAVDGLEGKRTPHPWIGWMRQVPERTRTDQRKLEGLLSHDGWLVDDDDQARFLGDLLVPTDRPPHIRRAGRSPAELISCIEALSAQIRQAAGFIAPPHGPSIDYVVRLGSRDRAYVVRCLESIAAQTHPGVGVVLVRFGPVPGLEADLERLRPSLRRIERIDLDGPVLRSTALWRGLQAVEAELFGMLDDDDALHPNHVASLVPLLNGPAIAYAGSVRVWETPGLPGRLAEPKREGREFHHLPAPRTDELFNWRMAIHSSAFIASADLLEAVGPDPELDFAEDSYLIRRLARTAPLRSSWRVSTDFYWREGGQDNTAFSSAGREESALRIADRERLDPVIARLRRSGGEREEGEPSPAWGQPARGAGLAALRTPDEFWRLTTAVPIYIYGSGFGGRVVLGELLKSPHLSVTGFLDSWRSGEAYALPLSTPDAVPVGQRGDAVVIIASEAVSDIAATLTRLGFNNLRDATPYIRNYVDLRRG